MSSTALVAFDNVRVPARYLVGKEGQGFKYIMSVHTRAHAMRNHMHVTGDR